jgi:uracil-DNA glycosylase
MPRRLELDPGKVPASNVVFARSSRGDDLGADFDHFADLCWPFHNHVIHTLHPKAVLCLGKKAGNYVRQRLGAHAPLATFVEDNNRRWKSHLIAAATEIKVIVATHPSIAAWTNRRRTPLSSSSRP